MATISTSMPLDTISSVPAPSSSSNRRSSEVAERFDDHLDRALESRQPESGRPATDERESPAFVDHGHAARTGRARIDRQHGGRRSESSDADRAESEQPTDDAPGASTATAHRADRTEAREPETSSPILNPTPPVVAPAAVAATLPTPTLSSTPTLVMGIAAVDAQPADASADGAAAPETPSIALQPATNPLPAPTGVATAAATAPTTTATTVPAAIEPPLTVTVDQTQAPTAASPTKQAQAQAQAAASAPETTPSSPGASDPTVVASAPAVTPSAVAGAAAATVAENAVVIDPDAVRALRAPALRPTRVGPSAGSSPTTSAPTATNAATAAPMAVVAAGMDDTAAPTRSQMPPSASAFAAAAADADTAAVGTLDGGPAADVSTTASTEAGPAGAKRAGVHGLPVSMPSLSMDLSDEGLGPLTVQATNGAGQLHLKLTAGDRMVSELLSRAGGELRRDLESNGTSVGTLDIGHSGANSTGAHHAGNSHAGNSHAGNSSGDRTSTPSARPAARVGVPTAAPGPVASSIRTTNGTVSDGVDVRI